MSLFSPDMRVLREIPVLALFAAVSWLVNPFNDATGMAITTMVLFTIGTLYGSTSFLGKAGARMSCCGWVITLLNLCCFFVCMFLYLSSGVVGDFLDPIGLPRFVGELATYLAWFHLAYYVLHRTAHSWPFHMCSFDSRHHSHDALPVGRPLSAFYGYTLDMLLLLVAPTLGGHFLVSRFGWGSGRSLAAWLPYAYLYQLLMHGDAEMFLLPDPTHHKLHHATYSAEGEPGIGFPKGNFGFVPELDWVFGTLVKRGVTFQAVPVAEGTLAQGDTPTRV
jgi:sterol desaturase/sphingolipid hydroxylase (fatty acid hydroxylase superfamily)